MQEASPRPSPATFQSAQGCSAAQRVIDAPAAMHALQAAVHHADTLGVRVNVSVVDAAGLPVAFARMAGAPLHSIDIATDKAYTAASFGLPTGSWSSAFAAHSEAVKTGLLQRPRFVAFGGGLPIEEHGARIGAIGVSGGSEAQDEAIAKAGLDSLGLLSAA